MSEEMIVDLSAPTLAGRVPFKDREKLNGELRRLNYSVKRAGIIAVPLFIGKDAAIVYVYRPCLLKEDISSEKAVSLLKGLGYQITGTAGMVAQLAKRFNKEQFPHEVGIFLGYPVDDVIDFIKNPSKGYKLVGTWKVYNDVDSARDIFRRYQRCTLIYKRAVKSGAHIRDLAVPI